MPARLLRELDPGQASDAIQLNRHLTCAGMIDEYREALMR